MLRKLLSKMPAKHSFFKLANFSRFYTSSNLLKSNFKRGNFAFSATTLTGFGYCLFNQQFSSDSKEVKTNFISTVKLKNGSELPEEIVTGTIMSLQALMLKNPIVFYELVMKARNPEHTMFGKTQAVAYEWDLIDSNGVINSQVRDVILSAVIGERLNMKLVNPIVLESEDKTENEFSKKL